MLQFAIIHARKHIAQHNTTQHILFDMWFYVLYHRFYLYTFDVCMLLFFLLLFFSLCILKYYTHISHTICFVFIIFSDFQLWTLQLHKLNSVIYCGCCCFCCCIIHTTKKRINHKLEISFILYYCYRCDKCMH